MIMKRVSYFVLAAVFAFSACTTSFLEVKPTTTVPEETSYATEDDITKALMAAYAPDTDFYSSELIEVIVCYLDACVSAVGIANGLFILFRYREQWLAWYICAGLETVINILSGQWVLLVLKAGYFTNTTYGYIKWTKYIKSHANTSVYGKQTVKTELNTSQTSDNAK